jgi:hypothetical protein
MYEIASIEQAEKPGIPSKLFPLGIDQKEKEMHIVHLIGALQPAQGLRTIRAFAYGGTYLSGGRLSNMLRISCGDQPSSTLDLQQTFATREAKVYRWSSDSSQEHECHSWQIRRWVLKVALLRIS